MATPKNTRTAPAPVLPSILVLNPGEGIAARRVEAGPLPLATLQRAIGGYVTTAGRLDLGGGRTIDALCHDEGLLEGLPWNASIDGGPICGPIVLTIGDDAEGESLPFTTAAEIVAALAWVAKWPRAIPMPSRRAAGGAR